MGDKLLATAVGLALCGASGINLSVDFSTVAAGAASITAAGWGGEAAVKAGWAMGIGERFDGLDAGKATAAGT